MKKILAILFLLTLIVDSTAQLSKQEKKIATYVDARYPESLKLLEQAVNINSGTRNFEGVRKVGELFKVKLDALGFVTRLTDGKPFGRAGHLVAEHLGGKGKTILLIGHLDTVFELNSPFQQFKLINDSTAAGPGISDMKGGDVIIIQALQALNDADLLKEMNIIIVMTGDEESSGSPLELSKKDLIDAAKLADIAIGFEDGDGKTTTAVVSRRSASGWTLKVKGVPAHSSQIFTEQIGAGAIYEASRILFEFYKELSIETNLTFNPGMIVGGTTITQDTTGIGRTVFGKSNVVSQDVIVSGDIRAISPEQLKKCQETMRTIAARNLPKTSAELIFSDDGYPPLALTEGNFKLLSMFDQVSRDFGLGPIGAVKPRDAGAADISFTAGYVDMALDGIGMGGAGGHTVNEVADLKSMTMEAKRAAVLLYRLSRESVALPKKR
jgi:glutamate carboxypeptidase